MKRLHWYLTLGQYVTDHSGMMASQLVATKQHLEFTDQDPQNDMQQIVKSDCCHTYNPAYQCMVISLSLPEQMNFWLYAPYDCCTRHIDHLVS